MTNSFNNKNLHHVSNYRSRKDMFSFDKSPKNIGRLLITFLAIILVVISLAWWYRQVSQQIQNASMGTLGIVNKAIGEQMTQDENGNINVLLLWFWGLEHKGWFLTDSMMVASFNPNNKAVTMISVPRDLFVNKDNLYKGKINSLLAIRLNEISDYDPAVFKDDFQEAEEFLREEVEEITGLTIPYYVGVSFQWFEKFIDELWWVTINVPQTLDDPLFPDDDTKWYEPFLVKNGLQVFDGETALKYARSRQTTSDFSRSYRQQQILSALIEQIKAALSWNKIAKMESLYKTYKQAVYTNITLQNALAMSEYRESVESFYSYVLSYECAETYELMQPGCVLYTPDRETFGWEYVLVPFGASAKNVSYYKRVHDFIYFVVNNQWFLNEWANIRIENAIDKTFAAQQKNYRTGRANTLARKLTQYGFDVYEIANAEENREETVVHTFNDTFDETLKMLQFFIDFEHIHHNESFSGDLQVDIDIQLWNDFIIQLNEKTHKRMHR